MPELPDLTVYLESLERRVLDRRLEKVRLASPFLLRSVRPPIREAEGRTVRGLRLIGKRLVIELDDQLFLVLHLMIAGRLRWRDRGCSIPKKVGLAAFDFEDGSLLLTEASSKKRASLHVVESERVLRGFDRGGLEVLDATSEQFDEALLRENRTLKRALTDPRLFSGIGNAYSDEILHRAGLSPVTWTTRLDEDGRRRLESAVREVLVEWTERLRDANGDGFPEKVTAFHDEMAVHGRYGQPCPSCETKVQRIVHAENETNYCPRCQTGGKLLADRALSRLLKKDWPKSIEELEGIQAQR
ncbi:MAG: DNA-formamidopyrimidine glycosylase family protein [Acidobacteriota bacterium]